VCCWFSRGFEHFSAGHTGRQAVRPAEPAKHQLGQAENIDQLDYAWDSFRPAKTSLAFLFIFFFPEENFGMFCGDQIVLNKHFIALY